MTRTITNCDECGAERTETNHWFSATVKEFSKPWLNIVPYTPDMFENQFDICGRECAQKMFERYLETGSIAKTTASPELQNESTSVLKPEGEVTCR